MFSDPPIMMFREEFDFLSNFFPQPIVYAGIDWQTSEHAYQGSKTLIRAERDKIRAAPSPGKAKRLGRRKEDGGIITLREDWKDVRISIMHRILVAKFSVPALEKKLLDTGRLKLVEGNEWKDTFWGVDIYTGQGQNMLGKLLMQIREEKLAFS